MACSGGWDWAPYSSLATGQTPLGVRTLAKGIWKSVYIVPVSTVAITDISPLVFYTGAYPTSPLTDTTKAAFNVSVRVFLSSPGNTAVSGTLRLTAVWTDAVITMNVTVQGDTAVTLPTLVAQPNEVRLSVSELER